MRAAPPPPPKRPTPLAVENDGAGESHNRPTNVGAGNRKKVASVRAWLVVDSTGQSKVVEAGKHAIMRRMGLPARDLRILDPVLSYPSTVLGREQAIVVNLEHIKAIITAEEVLFLNSGDPLVTPFIRNLEGIFRHRQAVKSSQEAGVDVRNGEWPNLYNLEDHQPTEVSHVDSFPSKDEGENAYGKIQAVGNPHVLAILPFEFVALEACLEAACSCLDNEARTLEQEAHPALDKLTSKISTLNLDRVRQIKSRLVAITGRVQKRNDWLEEVYDIGTEQAYSNDGTSNVRDELEHLLDDDEDMAEMYLTEKFEQQQLDNSAVSSVRKDMPEEEILPDNENRTNGEIRTEVHGESIVSDAIDGDTSSLRRDRHQTQTSIRSTSSKHLDVEELEMILEAYFVQIDGTLHKLSNLREYVDDTEDYINIMLDDKQNHLLQMEVMLTTATVVVSAFVALVGVFGMNITIELFDENKAGNPEFLWTVGGGTIASVFLYVIAIAWCKHKRLLE